MYDGPNGGGTLHVLKYIYIYSFGAFIFKKIFLIQKKKKWKITSPLKPTDG